MASVETTSPAPKQGGRGLGRFFPAWYWVRAYRREHLVGDVMAGAVVAVMLVPQSMAYALLAGLPPQVGLYASIVPPLLYALLGTSPVLAVGPVAIDSLMVASALAPLAEPGGAAYVQLALTLALMVGLLDVTLGLLRMGAIVNFLSQPVLAGFTTAAALVIGLSQFKTLLGLSFPNTEQFGPTLLATAQHLGQLNPVTTALGLGSIALLLYFQHGLGPHLKRTGLPQGVVMPLTRSAPLVAVLLGMGLAWGLDLQTRFGVSLVGEVPRGLPLLTLPGGARETLTALLPAALAISFVGYMEGISSAKALASRRRQKIEANQELIALGAANLGAALTGGYPVTGGLSRSAVNFAAGAHTGLASMVTAALIALTVLFFTPAFRFLPRAVLAAIIMVAVTRLFDLGTIRHTWRYSKADFLSLAITFGVVLALNVQTGIVVGVVASLLLFLWRTSRPHVAIIGRVGSSETYRNVLRHKVKICPHVIAMRVDESLYFANTKFLEDTILGLVADQPEVQYLLLDGSAINFIDASALETLEGLHQQLAEVGVELYLAAIKGPVMDRLQKIGFVDKIGADHIFLSTHEAMTALNCI